MVWLPGIQRARAPLARFDEQATSLLRALARRVANSMMARCTVYLLERDRRFLVPVAMVDEQGRELPQDDASSLQSISAELPVYERLLFQGRPCVLHARSGREPLGVDCHVDANVGEEDIASVSLVPLDGPCEGGATANAIGVVAIFRRRVGPSEARDVSLLARMVEDGAPAIARRLTKPVGAQDEAPMTSRMQPLMRALVTAGSSIEVADALVDAAYQVLAVTGAAVVSHTRSRASVILAARGMAEERILTLADPSLMTSAITVVERADGVAVAAPMRSNDREIARLILSYGSDSTVDEARKQLIRLVARQGAIALGRTRAFDAERDAWLRLAHLSLAGDKLSATIDWHETLRNVGEIFVPELATACALDLETEHGRDRAYWHPVHPSRSARRFPLETGGVRMGFLLLDVVPESDDELLLGALANRVAMALESARMFHQLQVAVRVRDEFVSIASHELKTPLTALKMCMFGIERFTNAPERTTTLATRQLRRLEALVDQLLDVSRIRAGRLELEVCSVDLSELAREAAEMVPGRHVEVHAPDPVVGCWDRGRINQVLINLLTNAVKYGGDQPIAVEVTKNEDHAILSVRDRGIGIEENALERIFDRFERAVSSRNYGGFGLGLWISREIVRAHGGSIRARSQIGNGSEFVVELPL